jgi:hypothetical protein
MSCPFVRVMLCGVMVMRMARHTHTFSAEDVEEDQL